jgi:hypothetical protein
MGAYLSTAMIMLERKSRFSFRIILFLIIASYHYDNILASGSWPIEPSNESHPIGNSAGELHESGGSFHNGSDIMDDGFCTNGHGIFTVEAGNVSFFNISQGCDLQCEITIQLPDTNQTHHRYYHLCQMSIKQEYIEEGMFLAAGTLLGQVAQWTGCPNYPNHDFFHHLHFEVFGRSGQVEPATRLNPRTERTEAKPVIEDVLITTNDSLGPLSINPVGPPRPVLTGQVDIVVKAYDRQFPTATQSHKTGVLKLEYRLSGTHAEPPKDKNGNPVAKNGSTMDLSTIPNVAVSSIYGLSHPIQSKSDYCHLDQDTYYYIVTNADPADSGKADKQYALDTTQYANGLYILWVTVRDTAGNEDRKTIQIEIKNP